MPLFERPKKDGERLGAGPMIDDSKAFRSALGAFATGVTIVTTLDEKGQDVGLTANSFNSVSLDPPLVLWSLAKTSGSLAAFADAAHFAVHILASDQQALSDQFAKRGTDKFAGLDLERREGGIPLLKGCGARFLCRSAYQYEGGDHVIFVGEVISFEHSSRPPLVFHSGSYALAARRQRDEHDEIARADDLSHLVQRAYFHLLTPVRRERERQGISLQGHYVLGVLMNGEALDVGQINAVIGYTGLQATDELVAELALRGLVALEAQVKAHRARVTDLGRKAVANLLAAAKAVEADALLSFDSEERALLKEMLRRLASGSETGSSDQVKHHMTLLGRINEQTA